MSRTIEGHSYETMPKEYWPKCDWCGKDIGPGYLFEDHHKRRMCDPCYRVVMNIIDLELPGILSNFFNTYENKEEHCYKPPKTFDYMDHLKLAIENLKKTENP